MSLRGCYGDYLSRLGYTITVFNDGNYEVESKKDQDEDEDGDDEPPPPPYVSLTCFYSLWRRDFGHIKVSKPSEDICNLCVAFVNRHKYKTSQDSEANSTADDHLFTEPPPFDYDDESDEEEEDAEHGGEPEEKSLLEQTTTTQEKSQVQQLLDDLDAVADDPELEKREQMIGRAYMHVEMARAQRVK
jgi:hypothetical protein